ncbi:MAG: RNA polymerase [Thermoplasmatales archaeon]|nr:RNA polymerase [Thermoplasmatales archaeon]
MAEEYISTVEVKDLLTEAGNKRGELNNAQRAALMQSEATARISVDDTKALIAELEELDFITDFTKYKIADILPRYPEDVRAIFSKERINLEKDGIDKIIEIVGKQL